MYVQNRIRGTTIRKTPFESWYKRKPDVSHLRVFGSTAYVHIPKSLRQKLDAKSQKLLFVGYSETQKAYRFFDRKTRRIIVSRDAIFSEFPPQHESNSSCQSNFEIPLESPLNKLVNSNEQSLENSNGSIPSLRRSSRVKIPKMIMSMATEQLENSLLDPGNLFNYTDAVSRTDASHWQTAMKTEMEALNRLGTWTLVPRPSNRTIVKCRWVYAIKRTITGSIERYRARLVAKGFSQKAGVDFDETFSPVVKYDSLRIILSIAAARNLDLFQFNVSSAFLYGDLTAKKFIWNNQRDFALMDGKKMFIDCTNVYTA